MPNSGFCFTEALSDVVVAVAVDSEFEPVIAVVISNVGNAVSVAGLYPGCSSHQHSKHILGMAVGILTRPVPITDSKLSQSYPGTLESVASRPKQVVLIKYMHE